MGANTEGTFGDEETGYAEHAGFDPGMETEGARKRLEEVAQWKGEIDCLFSNLFFFGKQLLKCTNTLLFH